MKLITSLTIFCIAILVLMQATRKPLAVRNSISGSCYRYSLVWILLFGFALTFTAAFRNEFQDTGVYKFLYTRIGTEFESAFKKDFTIQDYGFNLFMVLLNNISSDPQLLIAVSSVITFAIYMHVVVKYSQDLPFSLLLVLCISYIGAMNGLRQILAGSILLLGLPWILRRKTVPYILLVLLAASFHASAAVMLLLYFIIGGKRMNKAILLFGLFIVVCFVAPSTANLILGSLLEDSIYEEYLGIQSKMGWMRLIVEAVPVLVTLLYCWIQRDNHDGEDILNPNYRIQRMTDILINMQLISFGFTALGLKMVYFARISMYFSCVLPILLPVTIKGCFKARSAYLVKSIATIMYLIYFMYQILSYEAIGGWNGFELAI